MTTYRYVVTIDADSPGEATERIEEMIADEGIPAYAVEVARDPAAAADAIMVELAGLVDGIDDAEDVDEVLTNIAQRIVAKVLGGEKTSA